MTVRTTRVTGQIVNPLTNRPYANKRFSVRLNPDPCYSLDGTQRITRSSWITTDSGGYIVDKDGAPGEDFGVNADYDPANSYYTVQVAPGQIDSLVVPYSATPVTYRSCLESNPANPNPIVAGASVQQLTDETTRATAAENANANSITTLAGAVSAEATTRANADTANANAIAAEVTNRQNAVTSEATTARAAETANASAIAAETTARQALAALLPVDAVAWSAGATVHAGDKIALPDGGTAVRLPGAPTTTRGTFDATENGYWHRLTFRFPWLESVLAYIFGDSYGQGGSTTDCDLLTTYFDRLFARHRTQTPTNRSVGGKRSDEILMQQVTPNWVANSRGVVAIADVVLNDTSQYPDNTNSATTAAAFRSMLAYLTALYLPGITDTGVLFGPSWSNGATSTVGAYVDVSFTGDVCWILTTAVTTTGGTFTVKDGSGATLATITTGGYAQTFTLATKVSGFGAGTHSVRVALASGSGSVLGAAIPSPTPPLILWAKPGPRNIGSDTKITAYLAACAAVLTDFPVVVSVPVDSFWSYTTMLGPAAHPNDLGNAYVANLAERALFGVTQFTQGLSRLSVSAGTAATPYSPVSPTYAGPSATAPSAPTGVTASTASQVLLAWSAASDGGASISSYDYRWSPAGAGTWTTVTGLAPKTLSTIVLSGLTGGSSYDFQVRANNSVGAGAWSSTATATAGAPVTTYAADTFTRADAASTPGSTETGSFAWSVTAGDTYGVVSNQLYGSVSSTNPPDCVIDDTHADGTVSVALTGVTSESGGLAFRIATGGATGYIFYRTGGAYSLRQRTGVNAYTVIATSTGITPAIGDVLTVVLNGTTVTAKVTQGGTTTQVYTGTQATGATNTKHGVFTAGSSTCHFDNFTHTSATT